MLVPRRARIADPRRRSPEVIHTPQDPSVEGGYFCVKNCKPRNSAALGLPRHSRHDRHDRVGRIESGGGQDRVYFDNVGGETLEAALSDGSR